MDGKTKAFWKYLGGYFVMIAFAVFLFSQDPEKSFQNSPQFDFLS